MMYWIEEASTLGQFSTGDQARFESARALLPTCYSQELDLCINKDLSKRDVTKYPNCVQLNHLWTEDESDPVNKELHAIVERLPFCPSPAAADKSNYVVLGVVALAALGLGYVLAVAR